MTRAGRRDFRVFHNFNNTSKSYELYDCMLHVIHMQTLYCVKIKQSK